MRPYSPPVRTGTSRTYDGGKDVDLITKTVELDRRSSADSESRKVREITGYIPEDAGEVLGKPRGFGRRDVDARTPYIELLCFSCFVIVLSCECGCIPINVMSFVRCLCYSLVTRYYKVISVSLN